MSDIIKPEMEKLHNRVTAIPLISPNSGLLNRDHILFVTHLLTTGNVVLERHIVSQIETVIDEVAEYLPRVSESNIYALTPEDLTTIIAKAAMTGAAQTASDIGESLAMIDP